MDDTADAEQISSNISGNSSSSGDVRINTTLNINEAVGNSTTLPVATISLSTQSTSSSSSDSDDDNANRMEEEEYLDAVLAQSSDDTESEYRTLDEINGLLDEGLPDLHCPPAAKRRNLTNVSRGAARKRSHEGEADEEFNLREITVLFEKGKNTLEVLPGGWIEIRHSSGMPLYLHRKTRVCTMSRPYFLGPGSARKHSIPLSAIPCLAYRKALDREKMQIFQLNSASEIANFSQEDWSTKSNQSGHQFDQQNAPQCPQTNTDATKDETQAEQQSLSSQTFQFHPSKGQECAVSFKPLENTNKRRVRALPFAKVETVGQNNSLEAVEPGDVRKYCERLFLFKNIKCKRFKTWSARRKHYKEKKLQQLTLSEGAKLITFPVHNSGKDGAKSTKEHVMSPQGKSSVSILQEYIQYAMRQQPTYVFRELENAANPYSAQVIIGDLQYGIGYGTSKKKAKAEAAKTTIELFIPQLKDYLDGNNKTPEDKQDHTIYFGQVDMEDTRITQMCKFLSEPSPYTLLLTCLQRNFGQVGNSAKFEMIATNNQSNIFRMETGEHSVEVIASNKKEGKQLASQAMLKDNMNELMKKNEIQSYGTLSHLRSLFRHYRASTDVKHNYNETARFLKFVLHSYVAAAAIQYLVLANSADSIEEAATKLAELPAKEKLELLDKVAMDILKFEWHDVENSLYRETNCICKESSSNPSGEDWIGCYNVNCKYECWYHRSCLENDIRERGKKGEPQNYLSPPKAQRKIGAKKQFTKNFCTKDCEAEYEDELLRYYIINYYIIILIIFAGLNQQCYKSAIRFNNGDLMVAFSKLHMIQFYNKNHSVYFCIWHKTLSMIAGCAPPHVSHDLVWNATVKMKGGSGKNLEEDLYNELVNKVLKEGLLVPHANLTKKSIERHSQSYQITTDVRNKLEKEIMEQEMPDRRSKDYKKWRADVDECVKILLQSQALEEVGPRRHEGIDNFNYHFVYVNDIVDFKRKIHQLSSDVDDQIFNATESFEKA